MFNIAKGKRAHSRAKSATIFFRKPIERMIYSFQTFEFDLILGLFLTFWGPNELFSRSGQGSKAVLGSPYTD